VLLRLLHVHLLPWVVRWMSHHVLLLLLLRVHRLARVLHVLLGLAIGAAAAAAVVIAGTWHAIRLLVLLVLLHAGRWHLAGVAVTHLPSVLLLLLLVGMVHWSWNCKLCCRFRPSRCVAAAARARAAHCYSSSG
jgi:hypothetical protein